MSSPFVRLANSTTSTCLDDETNLNLKYANPHSFRSDGCSSSRAKWQPSFQLEQLDGTVSCMSSLAEAGMKTYLKPMAHDAAPADGMKSMPFSLCKVQGDAVVSGGLA